MSGTPGVAGFLSALTDQTILVRRDSADELAPAHVVEIDPEDWGKAAVVAREYGCRWAGVFAEDAGERLLLSALLARGGEYLCLRTQVETATPVLPSHTPVYPAADRPERHTQDLFGLAFSDHPDPRRWTRHQAWAAGVFPLRKSQPEAGDPPEHTPTDHEYEFLQAQGAGVYEIPVGPVHAGIIEPGHFRFQAVGEQVLNLEQHLGYVHKGIEKLAEGREPKGLARLAGRVSGDSTVAHTWAACMALERAAGTQVPARALVLRGVMAERERIANHLGDIGAICNDVAFAFAFVQFGRLREDCQRLSKELFGHRLMMDCVVPGGVARDVDEAGVSALRKQCAELRAELEPLLGVLADQPSLQDRLVTTGALAPQTARELGALGYVGFDGSLDTSILIRTVTAGRGWWQIPVGGGIVAQSVPEQEYQETWHKAEGMLRALGAG